MTPMLSQYTAIKVAHQDSLLFYRLGDFYELFFDDARTASKILDITLTKRGKYNGKGIDMCGVPYHSASNYIRKLVKNGYNVALCEQVETIQEARKRGQKAIVKREVVRIITPGTLVEEDWLDSAESNYLLTLVELVDNFAVSWLDVSTGDFLSMRCKFSDLANQINKLQPKEILLPESLAEKIDFLQSVKDRGILVTVKTNNLFDYRRSYQTIKSYYNVDSIKSFGLFFDEQIIGAGALLEYVCHTHRTHLPRIKNIRNVEESTHVKIDQASMENLELEISKSSDKNLSLINVIDRTITAPGRRIFRERLKSPLRDINLINQRFNCVDYFCCNHFLCLELREIITYFPDLQRVLAGIFSQNATPKSLKTISEGLKIAKTVVDTLLAKSCLISELESLSKQMSTNNKLQRELDEALINSSYSRGDRFVSKGYDDQLDELYKSRNSANERLELLRQEYIEFTGVRNLKIVKNNIIGLFIEVGSSNACHLIKEVFVHKQSLGSVARFYTTKLTALETVFLDIDYRIRELEKSIFKNLCEKVKKSFDEINIIADIIANIDFFTALSVLSNNNSYVRPFVEVGNDLDIVEGRHPVLNSTLKNKFVANSCSFSTAETTWLLTGPNMAGKSTFLRQNALIIIMAQMGSHVPARSARFGMVDKIFSRMGANDNIAQGESTFMVEMTETAYILNNVTAQSFVIFDEIGRGTSTNDGIAIAWAVLRHLYDNVKCRTLFSTHYHELAEIASCLPRVINKTMYVKEWENNVIFMYKIITGVAKFSYGVHVAKIAGLPHGVVEHAQSTLKKFLKKDAQTLLFLKEGACVRNNCLISLVKNLNLDDTTPLEAFVILQNLVHKAKSAE